MRHGGEAHARRGTGAAADAPGSRPVRRDREIRLAPPIGRRCRVLLVLAAVSAAATQAGCRKESDERPAPEPTAGAAGIIDFPAELQVKDASVNEFIFEAIRTCTEKDYRAFRLLWSAHEEPLPEKEFTRGWQATRRVTIADLRKMRTQEGGIVYAVRGLVELDPAVVAIEPQRDIVLLLVQEHGEWRLARAPRSLAGAMTGETSAGHSASDAADEVTATRPAGSRP